LVKEEDQGNRQKGLKNTEQVIKFPDPFGANEEKDASIKCQNGGCGA